eukprot:scaffold18438_cov61-Phaeocystis_antarctica.AAC.2
MDFLTKCSRSMESHARGIVRYVDKSKPPPEAAPAKRGAVSCFRSVMKRGDTYVKPPHRTLLRKCVWRAEKALRVGGGSVARGKGKE